MDKKIVFFDIDGTLIDDETHTVPQSAIDAIHKAQKNGHILIVNTGRPSVAVDKAIKDIGFDGFLCGCGTYIEYKNEVIFHYLAVVQVKAYMEFPDLGNLLQAAEQISGMAQGVLEVLGGGIAGPGERAKGSHIGEIPVSKPAYIVCNRLALRDQLGSLQYIGRKL